MQVTVVVLSSYQHNFSHSPCSLPDKCTEMNQRCWHNPHYHDIHFVQSSIHQHLNENCKILSLTEIIHGLESNRRVWISLGINKFNIKSEYRKISNFNQRVLEPHAHEYRLSVASCYNANKNAISVKKKAFARGYLKLIWQIIFACYYLNKKKINRPVLTRALKCT